MIPEDWTERAELEPPYNQLLHVWIGVLIGTRVRAAKPAYICSPPGDARQARGQADTR